MTPGARVRVVGAGLPYDGKIGTVCRLSCEKPWALLLVEFEHGPPVWFAKGELVEVPS